MSYAQPLSTLAPEYATQLQPVQQVIVTEYLAPVFVPLVESPKPCSMPCPKPCPLKVVECPKPCPKPCPTPTKVVECPKPCPKPCPPKVVECPKPCDPCAVPVACSTGYGWGWLGALILWFIVFTVLFWLIFYSLKPSFVLQTDSNQVDTSKVLLAAVIAALILVAVIWLIKAVISRKR